MLFAHRKAEILVVEYYHIIKGLEEEQVMKDVEVKLVAELMKNSRRSDRELARVIGVSQPTISRAISKLEKEGYIKEYTVIPNYNKLGYQLAVFTLVKSRSDLNKEEMEKAREISLRDMQHAPTEIVLFERGLGEGQVGILVSFHEDYSSYFELRERMKKYNFLDLSATTSFIIDLKDEIHYRYLTFSTLADNLLKMKEQKK
jgi:DNA-binding Lrp family transcriptional regulator